MTLKKNERKITEKISIKKVSILSVVVKLIFLFFMENVLFSIVFEKHHNDGDIIDIIILLNPCLYCPVL